MDSKGIRHGGLVIHSAPSQARGAGSCSNGRMCVHLWCAFVLSVSTPVPEGEYHRVSLLVFLKSDPNMPDLPDGEYS